MFYVDICVLTSGGPMHHSRLTVLTSLALFATACTSGSLDADDEPLAAASQGLTCTLPSAASVTPTVVTYRPGFAMAVYSPPVPSGAWLLVAHGGGGTSTRATKDDANVVAVCQMAASLGVTCFAHDYTVATSTSAVGAGHRDTLCALRYAAANAATYGANPARGGVAGISWGGTLTSFATAALRAGWTVPGGLGTTLPLGTNLADPTCPTAPAASDASIVKVAALWYSPLDFRSWQVLNTNGAATNYNLEIVCGASFGTTGYANCSGDLSPMTLARPTTVLWSLAQGTLSGVDGDGFVKLTTQANTYDAADTTTAPGFGHNFSPSATGGALSANCANFAAIGSL
jgi:acetyl esterase/lipase